MIPKSSSLQDAKSDSQVMITDTLWPSCRTVHAPHARQALSSNDPRQDRTLAPLTQEPHPARKLLPARRPRAYEQNCDDQQPRCRVHSGLLSVVKVFGTSERLTQGRVGPIVECDGSTPLLAGKDAISPIRSRSVSRFYRTKAQEDRTVGTACSSPCRGSSESSCVPCRMGLLDRSRRQLIHPG